MVGESVDSVIEVSGDAMVGDVEEAPFPACLGERGENGW